MSMSHLTRINNFFFFFFSIFFKQFKIWKFEVSNIWVRLLFVANNMLFRISRYRSQFLRIVCRCRTSQNNFDFFLSSLRYGKFGIKYGFVLFLTLANNMLFQLVDIDYRSFEGMVCRTSPESIIFDFFLSRFRYGKIA
jgi:hypothetical protein